MVPFSAAVEDASRGNPKLPQSSFLDSGPFPVVDQGQRPVAGYADDEALLCRVPGPVIVFGDHTRAFKYVEHPFVIGADGVKVLRIREGWDSKYVFHYLKSRNIPSAGYSRHFKFLKELEVPQPPLDEQRRIAAILDQADALRARRRQALGHLDKLTQSIFIEMFGDPVSNPHNWPRIALGDLLSGIENGRSPVCESRPAEPNEWGVLKLGAVTYGVFNEDENKAYLNDPSDMADNEVQSGDLLMTRKNTPELVGAVALVDQVRPRLLLPDLIFRLVLANGAARKQFLQALLMNPRKRPEVRGLAGGSAGSMPNISKARLRSLPIELPPVDLQDKFAARVEEVHRQIAQHVRRQKLELELSGSLQTRAFSGQL